MADELCAYVGPYKTEVSLVFYFHLISTFCVVHRLDVYISMIFITEGFCFFLSVKPL